MEKTKKWTKKEWKSFGFFCSLIIIPIIHFCVFYIGTNTNTFILAFSNKNGFTLDYFKLFFQEIQLSGAAASLTQGITNSLTIFAMSIVIILPCSLLFSYFLYKKILFHKYFRVVFFLPSIISAVVLVALYTEIVNGVISPLIKDIFNLDHKPLLLGSTQYAFKTVLCYMIWLGLAANMVVYSGAMARVPVEVVESAHLDGISFIRELWSIVLPLIWPTLSVILLLAVVSVFNSDGPILLMTQGKNGTYTLPYWIYEKTVLGNAMNYGAAVGLVFTVISIPIMLIARFVFSKLDNDVEY